MNRRLNSPMWFCGEYLKVQVHPITHNLRNESIIVKTISENYAMQ